MAVARGWVSSPVRVLTPAGPIDLRFDGDIYLTGPAEIVAEGEFFWSRPGEVGRRKRLPLEFLHFAGNFHGHQPRRGARK